MPHTVLQKHQHMMHHIVIQPHQGAFVMVGRSSNRDMPLVPNVIAPPVRTLAELPFRWSHCPINAAYRTCLAVSFHFSDQ